MTDYNTQISCELPWDGAAVTHFCQWFKRVSAAVPVLLLVTVLTVLILAFPLHSKAQSTMPPSEVVDGQRKKVVVTLSKDEERLVQDYLDVLKQLQALTSDYSHYFAKTQVNRANDYLKGLDRLMAELKDRTYLEDINRLSADIGRLQQSFQAEEETLKETNERAFRLSLSFSEELEAVNVLLQQDIILQIEKSRESLERIKAYLKASEFDEIPKGPYEQSLLIITTTDDGETVRVVAGPTGEAPIVAFDTIPPGVSIPGLPKITTTRDIELSRRSGGSGIVREFVDSIHVSSSSQPIYINNPIGDLEVIGWDREKVVAQAEIELSADSHSKARKEVQQVNLHVLSKDDGINVELIIPSLSDPETKIVSCALNVKVPNRNPIECTNSYGDVVICRIHNDVKLTASYSQVEIDGVDGHTEVTNSYGGVELSRITGPIKVTNSYSPIDISRCHGDMEIVNSFSSIELTHSDGNVLIHNSGRVDIVRHSGTIEIENKYGLVEVMKLDGDLTIKNSFNSLSIEDIFGSAEVNNVNGNIEAKNITGEFSAKSSFGSIYGDLLYGPIHITSQNGSIDVTLAEKLAGPSTIDASSGSVKVSLFPYSDLLVTAIAVGGDIQSYFPVDINRTGLTKKAEFVLGNGKTPLTLSSTNASIVISEAR